jgi:ketosteroid isomerase-like protein
MPSTPALAAWCALIAACHAAPPAAGQTSPSDTAAVRRELEQWYDQNKQAFLARDLAALMALRTDDFHSVTPDSVVHDRAEMEERTRALLDGIEQWIAQSFELDSIEVTGDLASAVVHQHVDRMARRNDGLVHHVETWVTQRETWRRTPEGWKLYRVDNIRDQRRVVDGKAG